MDPTINFKKAISDLEFERVHSEDLKIYVSLSRIHQSICHQYSVEKNWPLPWSKEGDVIYYYKSDSKEKKDISTTVPIRPEDISNINTRNCFLPR
jgi:hypothetical protein